MKKIYLLMGVFLTLYSCNNDDLNDNSTFTPSSHTSTINQTGSRDGISYSLKDVTVNPNLVKLNSENIILKRMPNDIENGKFNFEILSPELSKELIPGNVIYLETKENSYFRKITSAVQDNNLFTLETTEANIGDIFQNGTLELSVDTKKAEKSISNKNNSLIALRDNYENSFTFDIFNYIKEYKYGGMTLNPNTSISSTFNIKIGFSKSSLPNEVVAYYEFNTAINPYFKFEGAFNKKLNHNLIENVPSNLIDFLKTIELNVNIPAGGVLGNIPAKISINEINFPVEIEANIAKSSHLESNTSGKLKIGFAYYNGVPNKTSHFIYENSITNTHVVKSDLRGEVISDMKISIIPKVTLFNSNLLNVNGNIIFGIKSSSIGGASITNESGFASKGDFYSSGVFSFGGLGIPLYTTELFKNNKELWNIGNYSKTFTVSNFVSYKNSPFPCSGLTSYSFTAALDYKYPIPGKSISGDLEMTYDVYADNGSILEKGKTIKITPSNVSLKGFNFTLCIPFRKINFFKIAKTSYLKNIKIKDNNGYIATGIINPSTGVPYSQIPINR